MKTLHQSRLAGLDGLRAIAILYVVALHAAIALQFPVSHPLARVLFSGYAGVDLFFVLSGFLIGRLLFDEEERTRLATGKPGFSLRHFYIRRSLRIFPAFYVVALLDVFVLSKFSTFESVMLAPDVFSEHPWAVFSVFTYLSNYGLFAMSTAKVGIAYFTFWSLCVEEHFYVGWSLFLRVVRTASLRWTVVLGVILLSPLVRFSAERTNPGFDTTIHYLTHLRLDAILFGVLLAMSWDQVAAHPRARRGLLLLSAAVVGGLGAAGMIASTDPHTALGFAIGPSAVALFCMALTAEVACCSGSRLTRLLELRPLRSLGRVSYGMYLVHFLAIDVLCLVAIPDGVGPASRFLGFYLAAVLTSWAAARLLFVLVEQPFLRLKKRVGYPAAPEGARSVEASPSGRFEG